MSNNKLKLDKLNVRDLWPSKGIENKIENMPIWGVRILNGSVRPNYNPRMVTCLGCNSNIWPNHDCYGVNYKGHTRYVCERCYKAYGFQW